MLTALCYTQMWLQEQYPWQGPQNAVFSWRSCSKDSRGCVQLSVRLHLLRHLQSSGTPRGQGTGTEDSWAPTWKAAPHCHSTPKKPSLLTFQALPVWLKYSTSAPAECKQWEHQVGKGGMSSQVGGWSIPCCATFLPPAPAAMALQLFAHSQLLCHSRCPQR